MRLEGEGCRFAACLPTSGKMHFSAQKLRTLKCIFNGENKNMLYGSENDFSDKKCDFSFYKMEMHCSTENLYVPVDKCVFKTQISDVLQQH